MEVLIGLADLLCLLCLVDALGLVARPGMLERIYTHQEPKPQKRQSGRAWQWALRGERGRGLGEQLWGVA
ncbi:hypothetical protein Tco_0186019 [Tanacetum coccineum]